MTLLLVLLLMLLPHQNLDMKLLSQSMFLDLNIIGELQLGLPVIINMEKVMTISPKVLTNVLTYHNPYKNLVKFGLTI